MVLGSSTVLGKRLLTGLIMFSDGHTAGITGTCGVNDFVPMTFMFKGLYEYSDNKQDDENLYDKGYCPEEQADDSSGEKQQYDRVDRNDAFVTEQAYSNEQYQCDHLLADVFNEM